jgi:hypothetical protein
LLEEWFTFYKPLFIRGLSFRCCVQASLSLKYLKLTIPGFPYLIPAFYGYIGFFKSINQVLARKSGYKVPFTAFRALLPTASYSAG